MHAIFIRQYINWCKFFYNLKPCIIACVILKVACSLNGFLSGLANNFNLLVISIEIYSIVAVSFGLLATASLSE